MLAVPRVGKEGGLVDGVEPKPGLRKGRALSDGATDPDKRRCGRLRAELAEDQPQRGAPDEQVLRPELTNPAKGAR
eukprot:15441405-Alexandrium_andersonii.AAC.1